MFDGFQISEFDEFAKSSASCWCWGQCVEWRGCVGCARRCSCGIFRFAVVLFVGRAHDVLAEMSGLCSWV